MKKFLIFLVSIVVVVCVGLTTYYFMRNNEIITIKTKEIYCNAGDSIPLASLGIEMDKKNISKKTTFDYNAGGDEVTKFIKYDEQSGSYVVSTENAGEVTLVISTTNKKYPDFKIKVHIGNGSQENPYYIFTESELNRIGNIYRLDKSYKLMNDITVTSEFKTIGFNHSTSTWDGFNGVFDGQGHSIKGLNLNNVDSKNIGLFSTIAENGQVKNLIVENANVAGTYENAGIVAGVVNGSLDKVVVKNSTLTNSNIDIASTNGSIAGTTNGNLKMCYAENVTINLNGTEEQILNDVVAGGLVGVVNESTIQACYTNNVALNIANVKSAVAGGFVGEFIVGTETGSIQQSYANTTCTYEHFAAFIGEISQSQSFEIEKANMLRHLIGNIAVVYGAESSQSIVDADLVGTQVEGLFKNDMYVDRSAFFDKESALYLIRGYASAGEVVSTNEYVYYAIDMNTITEWDTTYVWNTSSNSLPTLRMGEIYPTDPTGEYFRRNLAQVDLGNNDSFTKTFSTNVEDKSIKLIEDVDLTSGWTPVSVKNTTIDGNNKTITINLNNAIENNLGLFTIIDNSTIKNLNIIVTGVSANATDAGALAGLITSTDELTTSSIENVTITYQNFATPVITNFGGVAGTIENATIQNVSVTGLKVNAEASVENAGAIVAVVKANSQINNSSVADSVIMATTNVGGIAAINEGTITGITGAVDVKFNSAKAGSVAGVVATNSGSIDNVALIGNISIENFANGTNVGGVSAINSGVISNVTMSGDMLEVKVANANLTINVGAIVSNNQGNINNIVNNIANVGTYHVGANHYVAGIAVTNSGNISKVVTQSNLYGNYVSGIVAKMDTAAAVIDQVSIGKYNAENRTLSQNEIKGDKYLAGFSVEFNAGTITNVQSATKLVGGTNTTRSSLITLIFPYGATIKNATVDSAFAGYGVRYRESWTDFGTYSNKAEFGFEDIGTDARFNVYKYDAVHGCMQSVVINSANAGVNDSKAAMGGAFLMIAKDYADTAESSFIKVVDGFNDISQFQGKFTFVCSIDTTGIFKHEATKELTFEVGSVWEENNGISLMFLDDIFAE